MKTNQPRRTKRHWLPPIVLSVLCAALTAAAAWYDLTYNGGKLVYPMNSYVFEPTDMPMLLALVLDVLCGVYLVYAVIRAVSDQKRRSMKTNRTRRLSPKFGLLGLLGFLGFAGFWSYGAFGDMTPFVFFFFFGFFGFFYEGKLSSTLMDERFRENAAKAELKAYRVGFAAIFLLLILAGQAGRFHAGLVAPALTAGIALAVALTMFLSEYLLYRYDHDEAAEPEGEAG